MSINDPQTRKSFDALCNEFTNADSDKDKKRIGMEFKKLIGHRLNQCGVFTQPNYVNIIDHKVLTVTLEYINTPYGYLAIVEHQFHTGCHWGSCGPLTLREAMNGDYVSDLNAYARRGVLRILNEVDKDQAPDTAINALKNYLRQTEQLSIFDTTEVAVLI